ncbi:MAG TPA: L-serine ammonia-lyase, iron-sulfur-dependent, subunit alpha, partial [Bacteroidales bacterium]|nr:L-serine ammonia-lyase, iron-sulfur-dependent, subunit alpha [Bacteroidales bacterium]
MRGPSSSHTAASVRIGLLGRRLLGEEPVYAKFTFDPSGSLATTYRGQGSAMGLAGGLLGMEMSDNDLVRSEDISREKGLKIEYVIEDRGDTHPNTYNVLLRGTSGQEITFKALSTGGGIVSLEEINGKKVEDDSEYINSLLPLPVDKSPSMPFSDIYEIKSMVEERGGLLSDYALVWESAIGNVSEEKIMQLAVSVAGIMKDSITKGLEGTEYADRILHRQSHLLSGKPSVGQLIPADISNRIIQSVTAIMEVKSSMGLIVAAPTAGSCAALPGSLLTVAEIVSKSEHEITRALLTGG